MCMSKKNIYNTNKLNVKKLIRLTGKLFIFVKGGKTYGEFCGTFLNPKYK